MSKLDDTRKHMVTEIFVHTSIELGRISDNSVNGYGACTGKFAQGMTNILHLSVLD